VEKLLDDAKLIAEATNQNALYDQMAKQIFMMLAQNGEPGVDLKKPFGAYVQAAAGGQQVRWALLLPITSRAKFLKTMQLPDQAGENAQYRLNIAPKGGAKGGLPAQELILQFAHGHAYLLATANPLTEAELVRPTDLFAPNAVADLAMDVRIDRLARPLRAQTIEQLRQSQSMWKKSLAPGMTAPQLAFVAKAIDSLVELADALMAGGKNLTFTLRLDSKAREIVADLDLAGATGSSLAASFASIGEMTSPFGELAEGDAAFRLLVHLRLNQELRALWAPLAREITEKVLLDDKGNPAQQEAERVFRALHPTIEAAELDFAAVLRTNGPGQPGSLVGGIKVAEGNLLDRLLQDKVKELPDVKDRELFRWNAHRVGDVPVHQHDTQSLFPPPLRQAFGDTPNYLAFGKNAIWWTAGTDGKKNLERLIPARPKQAPPLLLEVNVKQLLQLQSDNARENALAQKFLTDAQPGRFRLSLQGGRSLRLRAELDLALCAFVMQVLPVKE
jgi:hypothetical protein